MQIERRFSGSRALFCHALKQNRGISRLTTAQEHDFSKGSILKHMLRLAGPMTLAQLINVLYNIVDRIFIGQIGGEDSLALTGLGVCFPVITIVIAFTNLVGMGGAPLFSITRGAGDDEEAEAYFGQLVHAPALLRRFADRRRSVFQNARYCGSSAQATRPFPMRMPISPFTF